jgi:O-antigen ligase
VAVGLDSGGYFRHSWPWAALALASVAGMALLVREHVAVTRAGVVFVLLLAAIAGWTLLSGVWGSTGTDALAEAERTAVYVAGTGAFLLVLDAGPAAFLAGTVGGLLILTIYGLVYHVAVSAQNSYEGFLLFEPTGYANAQGILAVIGLLLLAGFAAVSGRGWARRTVGALALVLAVGLVLTHSVGSWVALAAGLGVAVTSFPRPALPRPLAGAVIAGGAVLVLAVVFVVHPTWSLGDRSAYWRVAEHDFARHPLLGSGAGSFDEVWRTSGAKAFLPTRDAHSLYLETGAELGLAGLVLLFWTLALPLVVGWSRRGEPLVAAAGAAYVAFLVHAGLDWDWEMPVVMLAGLACAAVLILPGLPLLNGAGRAHKLPVRPPKEGTPT